MDSGVRMISLWVWPIFSGIIFVVSLVLAVRETCHSSVDDRVRMFGSDVRAQFRLMESHIKDQSVSIDFLASKIDEQKTSK